MRLANVRGRASLMRRGECLDVEQASGGSFSAQVDALFERWSEFRSWVDGLPDSMWSTATVPAHEDLGPAIPKPRQVFAVALNYHDHVAETGRDTNARPLIFAKFPSCLAGPYAAVQLPGGSVDWEVELVAVIGKYAHHVDEDHALDYVAGFAVGQDISERVVQMEGNPPQFGLGKSFPGFGPIGPALVTLDEFDDPNDLELGCSIDGEQLQHARTSEMTFSVAKLVVYIASMCPLLPGDLIFTGTPGGVGDRRNPPRYLSPGETLVSYVEGIGELRNLMCPADRDVV